MERLLTVIATGLVLLPAFFWGAMLVVSRFNPLSGNSDKTIATSMMVALTSGVCAAVAFFLVAFAAYSFTPARSLRYLQIADVLIVVATAAVWYYATAQTPELVYPDEKHLVLNIEIRATKAILGRLPVGKVVSMKRSRGRTENSLFCRLKFTHAERAKENGLFSLSCATNRSRRYGSRSTCPCVRRRKPVGRVGFRLVSKRAI